MFDIIVNKIVLTSMEQKRTQKKTKETQKAQ